MIARPEVSVIIVGYNSAHVLASCVSPLVNHDGIEVILVDNNSGDETVDVFKATAPSGVVVERSANGGFAVAVNAGARIAKADILFLLNPDAAVQADQVIRLARSTRDLGDRAIMAPVVGSRDSGYATVTAGRFPSLYRMLLHTSGLSRMAKFSPLFEGHYLLLSDLRGGRRSVDWVTGGCMLVTRALWEELGGLTERWFMYAEDIEFCWRANQSGAKCILDTDEYAEHSIGGSSLDVDGRLNPAWIVNLFDFYRASMAPNRVASELWRALVICGFVGRSLVYATRYARTRKTDLNAKWQIHRYGIYSRALLRMN